MNIICNIVLIIFSSSITGGIFTIVWMGLKKYFGKNLRSDILYFTLKCALISFFVPSISIILYIKSHYTSGYENYSLNYTNIMRIVLGFVFVVIVLFFMLEAIKKYKRYKELKSLMKFRLLVKVNVENIVKKICERKNIKRKIRFYHGATPTPFIIGMFRPTIFLAINEWDDNDTEIALTHELNHYKQRDNIWKPFTTIMICLNWFNPLAWYVKKQMEIWPEIGCDYKCIYKDGIDEEEYFFMLVRINNSMFDKYNGFVSTAGDTFTHILNRANLYAQYSKRSIRKGIVALILISAIAISSITVYAATGLSEFLFNKMFSVSSAEYEEYEKLCSDGYVEHIIKTNTDSNEELITAFSNSDIKAYNYNADNTLVETIDSKAENVLIGIPVDNTNALIDILLTTEDKESVVCIGIYEPDGTKRYVEGTKIVMHSFEIDKQGDYKVFVKNNGDKSVDINLSVLYIEE